MIEKTRTNTIFDNIINKTAGAKAGFKIPKSRAIQGVIVPIKTPEGQPIIQEEMYNIEFTKDPVIS